MLGLNQVVNKNTRTVKSNIPTAPNTVFCNFGLVERVVDDRVFYVNGTLFLFIAILIIYPKWLLPYAGLPSGGYQIVRNFKNPKI